MARHLLVTTTDFVYLASGSPRRRDLLHQIGVPFQILKVAVDESSIPGEAPAAYVERLARAKAAAGWEIRQEPAAPVLAADTTVIMDGEILVKPTDRRDGEDMLLKLSERTHEVLTGVALAARDGIVSRISRSQVRFRHISFEEAREYWQTGEPRDKAGGYAVQGRAAVFIAELRGSYSGVMGLPLFETAELLAAAGVPRWRGDHGNEP